MVSEYQGKGLPHTHLVLILHKNDKLLSCEQFDKVIFCEIPDKTKNPELYKAYCEHMIHADCEHRPDLPCRINGKCRFDFPAEYQEFTTQNSNGYPFYRRRSPLHGGFTFTTPQGRVVTNRYTVATNAALLLKYNCHINVQICVSFRAVQYLFKYIAKGPERISMTLENTSNEIKAYLDGRYVAPHEACWRIFKFKIVDRRPTITRLRNIFFSLNQNISLI